MGWSATEGGGGVSCFTTEGESPPLPLEKSSGWSVSSCFTVWCLTGGSRVLMCLSLSWTSCERYDCSESPQNRHSVSVATGSVSVVTAAGETEGEASETEGEPPGDEMCRSQLAFTVADQRGFVRRHVVADVALVRHDAQVEAHNEKVCSQNRQGYEPLEPLAVLPLAVLPLAALPLAALPLAVGLPALAPGFLPLSSASSCTAVLEAGGESDSGVWASPSSAPAEEEEGVLKREGVGGGREGLMQPSDACWEICRGGGWSVEGAWLPGRLRLAPLRICWMSASSSPGLTPDEAAAAPPSGIRKAGGGRKGCRRLMASIRGRDSPPERKWGGATWITLMLSSPSACRKSLCCPSGDPSSSSGSSLLGFSSGSSGSSSSSGSRSSSSSGSSGWEVVLCSSSADLRGKARSQESQTKR
ncbi:hypothetical protein F7725_014841 [Dissostichus mawsoni]|uniref:Uncharacterized protein n=1 Tax=Dissostichus mawsoni TaxID=36200 RepID=A0A7J5YFX5_DISMA|nr:hypothetical protein F7725_014841 [Dissostichus mawsoni]